MPSTPITESLVEEAALTWFESCGFTRAHGPDLDDERQDNAHVVLEGRLKQALTRINGDLPAEAIEDAIKMLTRISSPSQVAANHEAHLAYTNGIDVTYSVDGGREKTQPVYVFDFENLDNNDWLVVNQFTIVEERHRRPDIVVFVNGLPLVVIELKNPNLTNSDINSAYRQIQTYKNQIASIFNYNVGLIISDGIDSGFGSLTANSERFMPWKTIDGDKVIKKGLTSLEVMIRGIFDKRRFLDLIRYFIVFEDEGDGRVIKKIAGYHQYHAVNKAVERTVAASAEGGDGRIGVVWHTQGSGKSLSMEFYAGKVIQAPQMQNPTIVVITDRNDLDGQLFGTFAKGHEVIRQKPKQANKRSDLRDLLSVAAGGVVFTTMQKFAPEAKGDRHPVLSDRRNIVVMADEAHRSQYGFDAKLVDDETKTGTVFKYGYAQHLRDALPNASFIGFTGTPIELTDKNTRAVFGDYIDIYDIQQAVDDGATVPIHYKGLSAKIKFSENVSDLIDDQIAQLTEGQEEAQRAQAKAKWTKLEAIVGNEDRLKILAKSIGEQWENRLSAIDGKGMIVCMSRRICVALYDELVKLRPEWHDTSDEKGYLKVIMTGSASDPAAFQPHVRPKLAREKLATRFKDSDSDFKLVIVRDMWLTGFDAPCAHTMFIDKPMKGHGLMQAIARVNRVHKNKPGGLIIDYIGLADSLKAAVDNYTQSGGKGETAVDQEKAAAVMMSKYEAVKEMFAGFDWSKFITGSPTERLTILPNAQEHILSQPDGKKEYIQAVTELSKAFALAVPHEKALAIREDVAFFQTIKSILDRPVRLSVETKKKIDQTVRDIVKSSISVEEFKDIFESAGIKKPEKDILSEEFLLEIKGMMQKNLAIELLRKLLEGEIRARGRKNQVEERKFSEMLQDTITKYNNRALTTAEVLKTLIELAEQMREAKGRSTQMGLSEEELSFYDALIASGSAELAIEDKELRAVAQELLVSIKNNAAIDWTERENVKAKLRVQVKRILKNHGFPRDKTEEIAERLLEQAAAMSDGWVA